MYSSALRMVTFETRPTIRVSLRGLLDMDRVRTSATATVVGRVADGRAGPRLEVDLRPRSVVRTTLDFGNLTALPMFGWISGSMCSNCGEIVNGNYTNPCALCSNSREYLAASRSLHGQTGIGWRVSDSRCCGLGNSDLRGWRIVPRNRTRCRSLHGRSRSGRRCW